MRSTVAMRLSQAISIFCAALLCFTLLPTTALASQRSLSLVPEGEQGAARIPSGAEGGASEAFSHYAADGAPSVDAGGADSAAASENADDMTLGYGIDDELRINEDVPLANTVRGFAEVDLTGDDAAAEGALEGAPEEAGETSVLSLENASSYAATQHRIYFEANGGSYVPYNVYKAAQGELMPNISGELAYSGGKPAPPSKAGCVFTGFYDGSDYARAKKYYNATFQVDATCDGRSYPADAEGLTLYAGFAPVLNVSVPLRVSIALGTVDELGEPTVASAEIVNATAAWPVAFTTLEWEKDDALTVSSEGMVAASETVNSLLASEVELSPSTMEEMFTDPSELKLIVTTERGTVEVPYAKGPVKLPSDDAANPLYLEAAPSTLPGVAGEKRLSVEFAIDKGASGIARADAVAETRLLSSYEAVTGWEEPSSYILFDMQGAQGGQRDRLPAKLKDTLPALTERSAPYLNGYDFLGYADEEGTLWYAPDGSGAIVAVTDSWGHARATVLHPVWDTKECTVVFTAGPVGSSATIAGSRVLTSSVKFGETLSTAFGTNKVPDPYWEDAATKLPYRFLGWFDEEGIQVGDATIITNHEGTTSISARWAGAPVTVKWDKGAANATSVDPTYLESGSAVGTLPVISRPGYTFAGWFTRAGGEGSAVTADTVIYENATFYASWTANYVNVSFLLDGTTFACASQLYDDGTVPALVLPQGFPASPAKEAHRFLGWYEQLSNNNLSDTALNLDAAKLPSADTTYVGKWAARVTYDAAGGAFQNSAPSEYYVAIGDSLGSAIPARESVTREGYDFAGWYSALEGGFEVGRNTLVSEPVTFYARWRGDECELSVSPYFDDVSWSETVLVENGEVPENLGSVPEKTGYELLGFYDDATKSDATLVFATDGTSLITWDRAQDATITARWIDLSTGAIVPALTPAPAPGEVDPSAPFAGEDPVNVHVATTPASGSALSERAFEGATNKELLSGTYRGSLMWNGANATAPAAADTVVITVSAYEAATDKDIDTLLATFAKEGQTLLGFEVASTGCFLSVESLKSPSFMLKVKGSDLAAATSVPVANLKDGALTATYGSATRVPVIPLTNPITYQRGSSVIDVFDAAGGTFANGSTRKTVVNIVGDALSAPSESPSRPGYDFDQWYTAAQGGTQVNTGRYATPATDTVFYAHWKTSPYKISYELAGGTNASANPSGYGVETPDITLSQPTRAGYEFTGWSGTGLAGEANMSVTIPKGSMGDKTYTAHWRIVTYAITYTLNSGTVATANPTSYTVETPTFTLTNPTRRGYVFSGWSGTGIASTLETVTIEKGSTGDRSYTANWTPYSYTLNFDKNEMGSISSSLSNVALTYDAPYTVPENVQVTHPKGPCMGWALDAAAAKVDFGLNEEITAEKLATLNGGDLLENGSTVWLYAIYDVVMRPKSTLLPGEEAFYLYTDSATATAANLGQEYKDRYVYLNDIKKAADDIAEKASASDYYAFFNRLLSNDVKFTTNWYYYPYNHTDEENTYTAKKTVTRNTVSTKASGKTITYKVRLLGINHDNLTTNRIANGTTVTKAGLTFQLVNLMYNTYQINETTSNFNQATIYNPYNLFRYTSGIANTGGWAASSLRNQMNTDNGTVLGLVPDALKSVFVTVKKEYMTGSSDGKIAEIGTSKVSNDKMFLPSYSEITNPGTGRTDRESYPLLLASNEGRQYSFYANYDYDGDGNTGVDGRKNALLSPYDPSDPKNIDPEAADNMAVVKFHVLPQLTANRALSEEVDGEIIDKKTFNPYYPNGDQFHSGYSWYWWTRSPVSHSSTQWCMAHMWGGPSWNNSPSYSNGISPCFCF